MFTRFPRRVAAVGRSALAGGRHRLRRLSAVLVTGLMMCGLVVATSGTAHATDPSAYRPVTWNMQYGADRWGGVATLATRSDTVALQEVPQNRIGTPTAPAGALFQRTDGNIDTYRWQVARGQWRNLYILRQPSRSLGMVTAWNPSDVREIPGVYRSALAVENQQDGIMFATVHASANGGADAAALVRNVAADAATNGIRYWAALGDFNRDPVDLRHDRNYPNDAYTYNTGQATQLNGNELDYMVSNLITDDWRATRGDNRGSDHWPVHFGSMQAAGEPQELSIHAYNSGLMLDVYGESRANDTHVITYHETGGANQRWRMTATGHVSSGGVPYYHIVSSDSGKCLDVHWEGVFRGGDFLNIWDCHDNDGLPTPGGPEHDTQNFVLEHPDPHMPNLTLIHNVATGMYANIDHNRTDEGAWVIDWPDQQPSPAINETFYLHPVVQ